MANYSWDQAALLNPATGKEVYGKSEFGQNTNNGNRMQPDAYYSDMFLERKRFKADELVFANYAETKEIKKGLDTINLRRYQPLKAHIVPLVEGLPPTADRAEGTAIIAKTRQYGRYMQFTDQFEYKVADPVIEEYTMELADLANETIDMLAQAALLAEAQVFFPSTMNDDGTVTKGTIVSKKDLADKAKSGVPANVAMSRPKFEDLRIIKLTMEAAKVKPINGVYVVLASPAVFFDLQADIDKSTIGRFMNHGQTNAPMVNDDIPVMYGIKVTKAHTAHVEEVEGVNIHHSIMLGAKAYTKVTISGSGGIQWFKQALGSAGTLDPLHQRQTMGWKISNLGFKVIDPDAVVDYMSVPSQSEIVFDNFDYVTTEADKIGITLEMVKAVELKKADGKTPATAIVGADGITEKEYGVDSSARELVRDQFFGDAAGAEVRAESVKDIAWLTPELEATIKVGMTKAEHDTLVTAAGAVTLPAIATTSGALKEKEVNELVKFIQNL